MNKDPRLLTNPILNWCGVCFYLSGWLSISVCYLGSLRTTD